MRFITLVLLLSIASVGCAQQAEYPFRNVELETKIAELEARIVVLESAKPKPDPSDPPIDPPTQDHWAVLMENPALIFSRDLKDPDHYLPTRGGGTRPAPHEFVKYDAELDAAKVTLPPTSNELIPTNGVQLDWPVTWQEGDTIVVQFEFMVSQALRELVPTPGPDPADPMRTRTETGYKFTNITTEGAIKYEHRTWFRHPDGVASPDRTLLDMRYYAAGVKYKGFLEANAKERQQFNASTGSGGADYDRHPGPDSTWPYGQLADHPRQFAALDGVWIRATTEFTRTDVGTRVKAWLADETTDPALIVASHNDLGLGYHVDETRPPDGWYLEMDGSQEALYSTPQPDRWAAFRNLAVLKNVSGESILGGRPSK